MIGNYNVDMSPVMQGLSIRAARIEEERKRQQELEINKLIGKSLSTLREGSPLRQLFEADPQKGAFLAKTLNIPLNNLDEMEQFSQNVRTIASVGEKDPEGAITIAAKLRDDRAKMGLDTAQYDKFLQTYQENPQVAMRALKVMDESLNSDLLEAKALKERQMKLQERGLDIQEKRIEKDIQQGESSYYQPIQTAEGLYAFNARTGKVEKALTPEGGAITPAQIDVGLQGKLAGAKTGGSEAAKSEQDRANLAVKNSRAFDTYNTAISGLQEGLSGTSTGYIQGKLPTFTASQQIAEGSVSAMAPILKDLFRSAGEGAFTDYDQKLLLQMLPTRDDAPEARASKINNINAIVQSKLGLSQQPPEQQKKQGGVEMVDANGNRAIVYPDGSYEEL